MAVSPYATPTAACYISCSSLHAIYKYKALTDSVMFAIVAVTFMMACLFTQRYLSVQYEPTTNKWSARHSKRGSVQIHHTSHSFTRYIRRICAKERKQQVVVLEEKKKKKEVAASSQEVIRHITSCETKNFVFVSLCFLCESNKPNKLVEE